MARTLAPDRAQTAANYNSEIDKIYTKLPGMVDYTRNVMLVRLQSGVSRPDVKLAHESGHVFTIANDPAKCFQNFIKGVDCQEPLNRHLYQVEGAMDAQENYLKRVPKK